MLANGAVVRVDVGVEFPSFFASLADVCAKDVADVIDVCVCTKVAFLSAAAVPFVVALLDASSLPVVTVDAGEVVAEGSDKVVEDAVVEESATSAVNVVDVSLRVIDVSLIVVSAAVHNGVDEQQRPPRKGAPRHAGRRPPR